jgi:hypothetical protein
MAIPKVKMPLTSAELSEMLNLPEDVDLLSVFVTNDPLSITVILASEDAFDELYLPDGGFDPTLSYKTVGKDFFESTP